MTKSRHLYAAAEFFVSMPLVVLAQAVEALGYENPQFEMSRVLSLQHTLKNDFEKGDRFIGVIEQFEYDTEKEDE